MKVSKTGEVGAVAAATEKPEVRSPAPREKVDKVSTGQTAEVEKAVALAKQSATGARAAKLSAIEAQVRAGTYQPNPSAIAERLLQAAEVEATIQAALRH